MHIYFKWSRFLKIHYYSAHGVSMGTCWDDAMKNPKLLMITQAVHPKDYLIIKIFCKAYTFTQRHITDLNDHIPHKHFSSRTKFTDILNLPIYIGIYVY